MGITKHASSTFLNERMIFIYKKYAKSALLEEIQVSREVLLFKNKLRFINAVFSSYHGCWLRYPEIPSLGLIVFVCLFITNCAYLLYCNMIAVEASIKRRTLTLIFRQICLNSCLLGIMSYQQIKYSNWSDNYPLLISYFVN